MKRLFLILSFLSLACCAYAQDVGNSVTLDEVTVHAAKVVSRPDGVTLYPTGAQKAAASNGYNLLQKLSLPNLRIDDAEHTIAAIDGRGAVQLRINGIVVDKQEMLALNPKLIQKVDFIDNPGLRYGEDIAYVICITTRRADSGYTLGADLSSRLTQQKVDAMVYAKWYRGKSECTLSYDVGSNRIKDDKSYQLAQYTLNDGSTRTIERNDIEMLRKSVAHNAKLTYNWADSTTTVFQASVSERLNNTPDNYKRTDIIDGSSHYLATSRDNSKVCSPVLDVYFFRQLTPRQSVTANAVGTHISSTAGSFNDEGTPYRYEVEGQSSSLLSEVLYEQHLKPFTLSTGLNYSYKHTCNYYLGDASAFTEMDNSRLYAFAEIKGMFHQLRYTLGTGVSYIHNKQNAHKYDFGTFRPKLSLAYTFKGGVQLSYSIVVQDRVSRIAMTNDATIRTNSMEWTVGNPDLKPSRDVVQQLRLAYNNTRWQTSLDGYYKMCLRPNMAHYERTQDDHFIYTQMNQKGINALNVMAYAGYWVVPEKLQVAANGGLFRCFNYGNDYTHCYTSWFYVGSITAYLGNFTLQGYIDNGSRFLEGETKGYSGAYAALKAAYKLKDWQFSLTWANPLNSHYKLYENELLNRNLYKYTIGYSPSLGNQISLNLSWRFSRGSRHKSIAKRIALSDTDNGIMK